MGAARTSTVGSRDLDGPSGAASDTAVDVIGALLLAGCASWSLYASSGRNAHPEGVLLGLLAVSAGFDAYKDDPITDMGLEIETFQEIGRRLANLTQPSLPCFAVLEGGYSRDFAKCVEAFINGWEQH